MKTTLDFIKSVNYIQNQGEYMPETSTTETYEEKWKRLANSVSDQLRGLGLLGQGTELYKCEDALG